MYVVKNISLYLLHPSACILGNILHVSTFILEKFLLNDKIKVYCVLYL